MNRTRLQSLFAAALGWAVTAVLPGAMAGEFVWQSSSYNDAGNKGRYTARLVYGVPESDNVQFNAVCTAGSSGRFASLVIGYNTAARPEGANVALQVMLDSYRGALSGTVYGTNIEEGVSGVAVTVDFDHPFWKALAADRVFSYALAGGPVATIGLSGSAQAVRKFIADCRVIYRASGPVQKRPAASALSCRQFGKVRSVESKIPVRVTFVNRTAGHRGVLWINFKGQPIDYAALNPGQSYRVTTYLTHPWMFTDGPGNCIEMYMPRAGEARFEITAPNPVFGPGND